MPNFSEDVEPQECTGWSGNRNWCIHLGNIWHYLLTLDTSIPHDPAILLLKTTQQKST